jgi:ubiquinol-cytochrome c reductase cytochrome b subunit
VIGQAFWPTQAFVSTGLFFLTAAFLALIGGLFQVNPIWAYGPFDATVVSSPAQPDWYLGWLEGALRLFPPWEFRAFGHAVPNPFFPGVVLPGVTFLVLYLWPFLEARFTGDHEPHHLLERPSEHPLRTAIGAAAFTFYAVLFFAASNDLVALLLRVPVGAITWTFRILALTLPPLVGVAVWRLMVGVRASGAPRFMDVPLRAVVLGDGSEPLTQAREATSTQEAGTDPGHRP